MIMQNYYVDGLTFQFPDNWQVSKYDDWAFYRKQFAKMWTGIKSIDLLAVEPNKTAWLIEVKDYRVHRRTKPSDLSNEIAEKVYDTLAAMLPAKVNANDREEKRIASVITSCKQIRVVLHLEQPLNHSKLYPHIIDTADLKQKIRQLIKPIDPHPCVVDKNRLNGLQWIVN